MYRSRSKTQIPYMETEMESPRSTKRLASSRKRMEWIKSMENMAVPLLS